MFSKGNPENLNQIDDQSKNENSNSHTQIMQQFKKMLLDLEGQQASARFNIANKRFNHGTLSFKNDQPLMQIGGTLSLESFDSYFHIDQQGNHSAGILAKGKLSNEEMRGVDRSLTSAPFLNLLKFQQHDQEKQDEGAINSNDYMEIDKTNEFSLMNFNKMYTELDISDDCLVATMSSFSLTVRPKITAFYFSKENDTVYLGVLSKGTITNYQPKFNFKSTTSKDFTNPENNKFDIVKYRIDSCFHRMHHFGIDHKEASVLTLGMSTWFLQGGQIFANAPFSSFFIISSYATGLPEDQVKKLYYNHNLMVTRQLIQVNLEAHSKNAALPEEAKKKIPDLLAFFKSVETLKSLDDKLKTLENNNLNDMGKGNLMTKHRYRTRFSS